MIRGEKKLEVAGLRRHHEMAVDSLFSVSERSRDVGLRLHSIHSRADRAVTETYRKEKTKLKARSEMEQHIKIEYFKLRVFSNKNLWN